MATINPAPTRPIPPARLSRRPHRPDRCIICRQLTRELVVYVAPDLPAPSRYTAFALCIDHDEKAQEITQAVRTATYGTYRVPQPADAARGRLVRLDVARIIRTPESALIEEIERGLLPL